MYVECPLLEVDGPDRKHTEVDTAHALAKIRTEDFLDVATSARVPVVVLDVFPRTGTSYWLLLL